MLSQGLWLLLLSGAHSQLQDVFLSKVSPVAVNVNSQLCTSSSTTCYRDNIHLCVDKQPISESAIVHTCKYGCSPCESGPHICNDEKGQARCAQANPDRFVKECTPDLQGSSFCSGGDVRFCNSSNLAVLVEYCDARGCQNDPLSCHEPVVRQARALLQKAKAKAKAAKAKAKGKANAPIAQPNQAPIAPALLDQPAVGSDSPSDCTKADPKQRVRVEWASMPDADRERYIHAVLQLYARGDMQQLAQTHWDNRDQIHGNGVLHFLIWHRVFLHDFEERLRTLPGYSCVTVPYWTYDYSAVSSDRRSLFGLTHNKLGQAEITGCVGGSFFNVTQTLNGSLPACIDRAPTMSMLAQLSNAMFTDLAQLSDPDFPTFSDNIQNAHGFPHVAVGGLLSTHYSPIDPTFWVHHANVDRLFSVWQDCHQNYQWFEPLGLQQPIIAYNGVTARDFIDLNSINWKGQKTSLQYSNVGLGNADQYSSDFRQRITTACQNGGLTRSATQVAPVAGVDDSWASNIGSQVAGGGSTNQSVQDVTLTCASDSGVSNLTQLLVAPLAVFDNLRFEECVQRCGNFYFKNSGPSNCVCTSWKMASSTPAASSNSPTRWVPSCGTGASYGLFQPTANMGRRLLQQTGMMQTQQPGMMQMQQPGMMQQPGSMQSGTMSNSMGTSMAGSTTSSSTSSSSSVGSGKLGKNRIPPNVNILSFPLNNTNTSNLNNTSNPNNTSSLNNTSNLNNTFSSNWNSTNSSNWWNNSTNSSSNWWNSTSNTTTNINAIPNATHLTPQSFSANAPRICLSTIRPATTTPIPTVCSTPASTPQQLPAEWIAMNRLNPARANACQFFRPANLTRAFDCVQNQN